MLVLTRKLGESIVIGDDIVVRVSAVQGSRVKLAIEAPRTRRILRGEIAEQQLGMQAVEPASGWGTGAPATVAAVRMSQAK
jgi:carbon storage regulator